MRIGECLVGGGANAAHSKSVIRDQRHERFTWGAGQAGIDADITRALVQGLFPPRADSNWVAIALVWVDCNADQAELVYANNTAVAYAAVPRALMADWPSRNELAEG